MAVVLWYGLQKRMTLTMWTDIEIYLIGPWLVVVREDDDAIDTDDFNGHPAVPSDDDLV